MKIYALFASQPNHDSRITGVWHYMTVPGGGIFVSEPRTPELYDQAVQHLTSLGGAVFPEIESGDTLTEAHINHPAVKGAGLTTQHNTYKAAKLMAAHFGWNQLDPRLKR